MGLSSTLYRTSKVSLTTVHLAIWINAMDCDGEPVTRLSEDAGSNPSRRLVSISVIRSW